MRSCIVLGVALAALGVACGGAIDPNATDDEVGSSWSPLLTCEGGTIRQDLRDARRVQLVLVDATSAEALAARVRGALGRDGKASFEGVTDDAAGPVTRIVDTAGRFEAITAEGAAPDGAGDAQGAADARSRIVGEVVPDGRGGAHVTLREQTTTQTCTGSVESRYCRRGGWVETTSERELVSLDLHGCR